jgi:hypothetical protein
VTTPDYPRMRAPGTAVQLIVYFAWYAERSGDKRWKQSLVTPDTLHLIAYQ